MNSHSIHNFEFVRTEPTTSQILFEILLPDCDNAILKITTKEASNFIFYTYVLSSIYLLYSFQKAIIHHHGTFSNQSLPIIASHLSSINHAAIYLHCVWDNLFRYLFNTLLGLPYGTSFFYPTPQCLIEVFLLISIYHPTSEGLNFWTKHLSFSPLNWLTARAMAHVDGTLNRQRAKANECVKRACQNGDLDNQVSHIPEPLELQLEDNLGVEGRDDEYQALFSDISDVVEDLENIISQIGDSGVANAHDLDTLWGLIERSKWGVESEGVKEIHGDKIDEEEWSILGESVVLQGLVNSSGFKIKGVSQLELYRLEVAIEHNRARYKAPITSTQENIILEHDSVSSTNARDSRYPKATLKVHNTHEVVSLVENLSYQSTILKLVSLSRWQSRRTVAQLLHCIQCLRPTTIVNLRSIKPSHHALNSFSISKIFQDETQDLAVVETKMWPMSIKRLYVKEAERVKKKVVERQDCIHNDWEEICRGKHFSSSC
ncbi:uncharacterized protein Bfra_007002 [Botrytis fragariae]|uniref:Uncharacterized protein n=1 Tax=Botrytis fragariae TaxID=1964551 RepID=A0A8H6AHX4_9HELO|nr:uncharacterized protein Bfra_007002 [Botrytis fragariae]KAF5867804.1 hypothetical protein Bfra_007002 [Botrytis fragariae]